jgi:hypothetical protein
MRTPLSSASDNLEHISLRFIDSLYVTYLITLWNLRHIGIRGLVFRPFSTRPLKPRYPPFMEKSQQRVISDYFSLKGCGARKLRKKLTDKLGSDVYSQAQISRWFVHFSPSDISFLDEARPGRPLSILGSPLEHFLENSRSPVRA